MDEGDTMVPQGLQSDMVTDGNGLVEGVAVQNSGVGSVDERTASPQVLDKLSNSKKQEVRALQQQLGAVQQQLEAYEKQYRALQQQLRQRDIAMMDLADENEHLNKTLSDRKESMKEAAVDFERQTEKIKRQERSLQSSDLALRKAQAEAVEARKEANEARRDANDARREATETSVALADAKADVWAIQEAAKGKALGEDERRELEGALKALSASAQRAAQEAGIWKESAQSWKGKMDSVQEKLDVKANALAAMENELAQARQHVKDSEIRVQEASHLQSVAELALQELRQESDRRARTFNSAVKAAVSKIQGNLEADRDAALQQVLSLQSDVGVQNGSLIKVNEALTAAEEELSNARARIGQLEEEREETKEQVGKLQEQVESWQSAAEASGQRTDAAHEVADGLATKLVELETRFEELTNASEVAERKSALMEGALVSDVSRLKSALSSAQNEKQVLQAVSSERMSKTMAEQIALRATISDLEGQMRALRIQDSGKGPGARPHWFDNLGLERVTWKNKLQHEDDVEKLEVKKPNKGTKRTSTSSEKASSFLLPQSTNHDTSVLRGRLSRRSTVMIIYIVALHIIVMVSFTQRSQICVDMVEQTLAGKLPGL